MEDTDEPLTPLIRLAVSLRTTQQVAHPLLARFWHFWFCRYSSCGFLKIRINSTGRYKYRHPQCYSGWWKKISLVKLQWYSCIKPKNIFTKVKDILIYFRSIVLLAYNNALRMDHTVISNWVGYMPRGYKIEQTVTILIQINSAFV